MVTAPRSLGALALGAVVSCGGSDEPSNLSGNVEITAFVASPALAGCGITLTTPLSWVASPDTILLQVQMVNTTAEDLRLTSAGTVGTVITASVPADVGTTVANFPSLPFAPAPAVLAARVGDLPIRVSLPVGPLCRMKPIGFGGDQEINITARMTTPSGQFVTLPRNIRITWQ